ncbi:hypothetical protein [Gordonia humi]|uniref:ADP ribosyltransferase domain-containing protein n=1 Tax=Gordonia humi TaxID=686429 RepID=A0A840EVZ0_9ACTN|nr:hypothetical protein [Gordonia humi]MBB4134508.1 hypothetical protein [Gordonia humi]
MDRFYQRVQNVERTDSDDAEAEEVLDVLDALIARSPLSRPITVWRGLRNVETVFGTNLDITSLQGRIVDTQGLMATSTSRTAAIDFTSPGRPPALLRVRVPYAFGHLWVAELGDPDLAYQREVLIHPKHLVIVDVIGEDFPVISAEVR